MPSPSVPSGPPAPARRVFRYAVPVDDQWHTLFLSGAVLHVATRAAELVELWALETGVRPVARQFRVFGTGHGLPPDVDRHVGSTFALGGRLVWHLFERHHGWVPAEVSRAATA